MGRDFRGSTYYRNVFMGKRTIKDGESAVIWNRHGKHRVVQGPYLKRMILQQIQFMDRYTAQDDEYLKIKFKDGHVEHLKGPRSVFLNPVKHTSCEIHKAIKVKTESECIVVYHYPPANTRNNSGPEGAMAEEELEQPLMMMGAGLQQQQRAKRQVIKGPCVYFKRVGDSVEEFAWLEDLRMSEDADNEIPAPPSRNKDASTARNYNSSSNYQTAVIYEDQTDNMIIPLTTTNMQLGLPLDVMGFEFGYIGISLRYNIENVDTVLKSKNPIKDIKNALAADIATFASDITEGVEKLRVDGDDEPSTRSQPLTADPQHQQEQNSDMPVTTEEVTIEVETNSTILPTASSVQRSTIKTTAPPTFKELLFVLENMLSDAKSSLRVKLSSMAQYTNLQKCVLDLGIKVCNIAFLSLRPNENVRAVRMDIEEKKEQKVQAEEESLWKRKQFEFERCTQQANFEASMEQQRQTLASQREHMQTEHDLENQEIKHKLEMSQAEHRSKMEQKQQQDDLLVRLCTQLRAVDSQLDFTPLLISSVGGSVSWQSQPTKDSKKDERK